MRVKVGDKVRLKTTYYGDANNGRQVVVTNVRPEHPFPVTVDLEGWHAPVTRSEIHTFQDTLDEMERVSAANNEEPDSLEEREHAAIVTLLNDAYAGDFNGVDADRVIEYIDKLRRNQ